jgi:hypothetical protein
MSIYESESDLSAGCWMDRAPGKEEMRTKGKHGRKMEKRSQVVL